MLTFISERCIINSTAFDGGKYATQALWAEHEPILALKTAVGCTRATSTIETVLSYATLQQNY